EWLNAELITSAHESKKIQQEQTFLFASLQAELLHDFFVFIQQNSPVTPCLKPLVPKSNKTQFALLAAAGTVFAACEGFDSISTLMGTFSLPSLPIFLTSIGFSALSIVIFYSLDLVHLSQHLGVKFRDAPQLLDLYLLQMNELKAIRRHIETFNLSVLTTEELYELEKTLNMVHKRFHSLVTVSEQFSSALNSKGMTIAKNLFSAISGMLFFASGFCAGQTASVFILSLFIAGVTPLFWPVILCSVVVGLAAFSLYWNMERGSFKKIVSGWFGLDEEKLGKLCDQDILDKEAVKITHLKEKIISTSLLTARIEQLQQYVSTNAQDNTSLSIKAAKNITNPRLSTNIYRFHAKPSTQASSIHSEPEQLFTNKAT
ncbi:MAG: hypothetical protein PSV35_06160, partial [bacterium]|nr:hypothetical protein [bacterium]